MRDSRYDGFRFQAGRRMTPKQKPRSQRLLLAAIVALFVLLLLLRLLVFVERGGRHRFRGAGSEPTGASVVRIDAAACPGKKATARA